MDRRLRDAGNQYRAGRYDGRSDDVVDYDVEIQQATAEMQVAEEALNGCWHMHDDLQVRILKEKWADTAAPSLSQR